MSGGRGSGRPRGRWPLLLAYVLAQAITLTLLLGPLWGTPWWRGFRRYFANDQLSYAAIATNVSVGDLRLVEPFTLTGSLFYPSLWYQAIGLVARVTGLPVYLVWTLLGLLVVGVAVAVVGWAAYRFSGRAYAPVLPALALLTGSLSTLRAEYWFTSLHEHAVLWGPYGTLFTLNAEVAGLSTAAIALSLLAVASRGAAMAPRRRAALVIVAALLVGLLANVQTYSFFTALSLAAVFVATRSLLTYRSRARTLLTIALVAAVFLLGPAAAGVTGPLPTFGLLLLALVPAAGPAARTHPAVAAIALATTALAAAPQVIRTLFGLAGGDPFLLYRQASTDNLGVPTGTAFVAALPLLLIGLVCAIAVWRRRETTLASLLIALPVGVALMASNDRWGFNQEPYRFWLQYGILAALLLSIVLAWSLEQFAAMARPRRIAFAVAGLAAATIWAVGLTDVAGFWSFARQQGVIAVEDARSDAVRRLLADRPDLVMSSVCLDPGVLKLVSRGPVASYNAGLAWPADVGAFAIFKDIPRRAGEDPVALKAAGVGYVLTDSSCADDWRFPADQRVVPLATEGYRQDGDDATITLWRVLP